MNAKLLLVAAFPVAFAMSIGTAVAQSPKSRAEVKSETRAAERAGALTPAGEGPVVSAPSARSTKSRADRKAETLQARAAGDLEPAGPAAGLREEQRENSRPSTVNRGDRKAATRAAEKAGRLVPAGEGPRENQ